MFIVEGDGRIAGSQEEVFDFFADVRNEENWNRDVSDVRLTTPEPVSQGSVFTEKVKGVGLMQVTHTVFDRPHRLDLIAESPRIAMRFRFDFTQEAEETGFRAHCEVEPRGRMKLLTPLLKPTLRRTFRMRPAQLSEGLAASKHEAG